MTKISPKISTIRPSTSKGLFAVSRTVCIMTRKGIARQTRFMSVRAMPIPARTRRVPPLARGRFLPRSGKNAFLSYFLCLTKSMETFPAGNAFGGYAALKCRGAAKGYNWHCAKFCLGVLIRGLQNLESSFGKGFNFVGAKPPLRWAESRFGKPRSSLLERF